MPLAEKLHSAEGLRSFSITVSRKARQGLRRCRALWLYLKMPVLAAKWV
jgi:hypothetical protein